MTNTQNLLDEAKIAVRSQDVQQTASYVSGMALRAIHDDLRKDFLQSLREHPTPDPLNITNGSGHVFALLRSDRFKHFSAAKTALEVSDESQAFKDAFLVLTPLVAEVARLEGVLEAEQRDYGNQLNAIREAQDFATAKAQAALDSDPKIQKMLEAAEASRPSHVEQDLRIFRGRVVLNPAAA